MPQFWQTMTTYELRGGPEGYFFDMKTTISVLLAGAIALLLAGCATTSGNFCDVAAAIRPSVDDAMTDGTKRQILAHNEYGARACNW